MDHRQYARPAPPAMPCPGVEAVEAHLPGPRRCRLCTDLPVTTFMVWVRLPDRRVVYIHLCLRCRLAGLLADALALELEEEVRWLCKAN